MTNKYYRRGAPRYLLTTNEAALPGAAFIVFTGKPGLVARLQFYSTKAEAWAYIEGLPAESIHTITDSPKGAAPSTTTGSGSTITYSTTVIELVHVINPSQDLHRDKLIRMIEKMSTWYYRTQVEGLGSVDEEE